jgi:copper transport protein
LALGSVSPASAHAIVERTEPAIDQVVDVSPERVLIEFNEPVEIAFGAIRVFNTNGERVDDGSTDYVGDDGHTIAVPLKPQLPDGTYTVSWRVVSADSHPIEEAFVFHVGAPGPNSTIYVPPGESGAGPIEGFIFGIARWLAFMGLLSLGGAVIFAAVVWRSRRVDGVPPADVETAFVARWRRILTLSWLTAVIGSAASFVMQGAVGAGVSIPTALSPTVLSEVASTRYGKVMIARLVLLTLGGLIWIATRARAGSLVPAGRSAGAAQLVREIPTWVWAASGAIVVGLLVTPGLAGHAGTTDPVALNLTADSLHMVAAAAWMGGLATLLLAGFPACASLRDDEKVAAMGPVVARFSDLAMVAVAVLTITGTYRAWVEIGALRALTGATYGIVLLTKVGVFLPIVVLGFINNRYLKPRIAKTQDTEAAPEVALAKLRRLVGVEVALGVVVVAITALLVNLPPAKSAAGVTGPFITDVKLGDDDLNVLVDPNEVGENEVHLTLTSPTGAPVPVKEMTVLFSVPSKNIGPIEGKGRKLAVGHYVVQGHQLSIPGRWTLEIVVRTSRFDEERVSVPVEVNG